MERLTTARVAMDLGAPVMEQLVLTRLLADGVPVLVEHRARLREQRDRLAAAIQELLPSWRFRLPTGGLALWCELPLPRATAVAAEAERRGLIVTPGPVFAAEGGLDRFVRIPWTRPGDELEEAVRRLAAAWDAVRATAGPGVRGPGRVMVA
jgi:DNA-binding transcriptional MocR family regulator